MLPEKRGWLYLVIPMLLVLGMNLRVDATKPLVFDEMVVSRTALQPDLAALWRILASGQSPHPPLNFLAVRGMYRVFGVSEISTRIPSTLGFTVLGICLFFFVSKRSSAAFGAVAMLFPVLTLARYYSVEAKPYGALLGWTGVALVCWQSRNRGWAMVGLGTALACATSSQFFGALLSVPIIAGEAVRAIQRKSVDWLMAAVISLSFWPLVFFVPILKAGQRVHGVHPWQSPLSLGFIPRSYSLLLVEAAAPILVCLLVAGAFRIRGGSVGKVGFPLDEVAAVATLALLPVLAFCGLRLAGIKVIEEKYLITMVAGMAILFSFSLYGIAGQTRCVGTVLAAIVLIWGLKDFTQDLRDAREERFEAVSFSPPASADKWAHLPIVLDTTIFAVMENYSSPAVASRIYYVADPVGREKNLGTDALDRSLLLNPGFFGRHVEPAEKFDAEHKEFLFCGVRADPQSWVLRKYLDAGARVQLLNYGWNQNWYLVTR